MHGFSFLMSVFKDLQIFECSGIGIPNDAGLNELLGIHLRILCSLEIERIL
jgi:hypothetical protein